LDIKKLIDTNPENLDRIKCFLRSYPNQAEPHLKFWVG